MSNGEQEFGFFFKKAKAGVKMTFLEKLNIAGVIIGFLICSPCSL